jgi:hypothetical protein
MARSIFFELRGPTISEEGDEGRQNLVSLTDGHSHRMKQAHAKRGTKINNP